MTIPTHILEKIAVAAKPLIVAVSGVGGAGKSTFAEALSQKTGAQVVSVDSFMTDRTVPEYKNWEIMDYERLTKEVILPFLNKNPEITYGHFDWGKNDSTEIKSIPVSDILIIEGVGLFRPELNQYFGLKIWIEVDLEEALNRGKKRDREVHQNPQDENWDGVWKKNDEEYVKTFNPQSSADEIVFNP